MTTSREARWSGLETTSDSGPWAPSFLWPNFFETGASALLPTSPRLWWLLENGHWGWGWGDIEGRALSEPASSFQVAETHNCPLSAAGTARPGVAEKDPSTPKGPASLLTGRKWAPGRESTRRDHSELTASGGQVSRGFLPLATTKAVLVLSFRPQTPVTRPRPFLHPGAKHGAVTPARPPASAWTGWCGVGPAPDTRERAGPSLMGRPSVGSRVRPAGRITRCSTPPPSF